jgi:hypothetical protein
MLNQNPFFEIVIKPEIIGSLNQGFELVLVKKKNFSTMK